MAGLYDPTVLVEAGGQAPAGPYRYIGQMGTEDNMQDVYTTTPAEKPQTQIDSEIPPGVEPQFWQSAIKVLGYNPMKINPVEDAMKEWGANEKAAFQRVFAGTDISENNMTPEALKYWNDIKENTLKQLTDMYKTKFTVGKQMLDYMTSQFEKRRAEKKAPRRQYVGVSADGTKAVMFNPVEGTFEEQEFPEGKAPLPKQMSEDLKKDTAAIAGAYDIVNQLKTRWDSMKLTDRLSGAAAYGAGIAGKNVNAKTYTGMREAFLGQLSRSIAAERGVLTNQDIDRISKALPQIGFNLLSIDNQEEAEAKWNEINTIINNAIKRAYERRGLTYTSEMEIGDEKKGKTTEKKKGKFTIIKVK